MAAEVLHLSTVIGSPLLDASGEKLGVVEDLIVRLGDGQLPPVAGIKARIGGRELFVPEDRIESMSAEAARLKTSKLNLTQFERRPGEVLLAADVLGRSLINVNTAHLVKAQEVELTCIDGRWRVAGIDSSRRARMRRLLHRQDSNAPVDFLEWTSIEPFVGHVPTARLRLAHRRLANLHPAQIADLVEAASHDEGEEIMQAVGQDRELEADVFEELDEEHQLEFLRERSDAEVAAILAEMASDDAADLLLELDQSRRLPVLELLPPDKQRKIRTLLGFNPSTAGGLMSVEYLQLDQERTVEQALDAVRASEIAPDALQVVFLHDADDALVGELSVTELLRADTAAVLATLERRAPRAVGPESDLPEIARLMTDYNLINLPVVDDAGKMLGVLTVDDVLESLLPADWRKRYGLARG
jgi:CBS domain-containing protein